MPASHPLPASRPRPRLAARVCAAAVLVASLGWSSVGASATGATPRIAVVLSAPSVRVGWSVVLRGQVTPSDATPYVVVQRALDHAWSDRDRSGPIAADGTFAVTIHPTQVATYTLRVRSADGSFGSARLTLHVVAPPTISASIDRARVAIGSPLTITGVVRPAGATRQVVSQRWVDGRWVDRQGAAVDATTGAYRVVIHPSEIATYRLRVRSAGGSVVSGWSELTTMHVASTMVDTGDAAPGERVVAFTIDDGPSAGDTARMLDVLDKYGVKATFGIVGYAGAAHRDLLLREAREGHRIVNQSWDHPQLTHLSDAAASEEIGSTQRLIASVGQTSRCVRPPYGDHNARIDDIIARYDSSATLLWSVDPSDYLRPGVSVIVSRVMAALRPGAIIGIHDGGGDRSQTVAAVDQLIPRIRAAGYQIRPVC